MFSPTTPRQTTTTKRRNAAGRRVYGKRKADAPRAVFDQKSPPKDLKKEENIVKNDEVDAIRAKVAGISLGKGGATKKTTEEKDAEGEWTPDEDESEQTDAETVISNPKEENIEYPTDQSPEEDTPAKPMGLPTVEVQISPRRPVLESDKQKPQDKAIRETCRGRRAAAATTTTTTKKKPAQRQSSGCVHDKKANEYTKPILDEALSPIAAQGVQKFSSWAARGGNMLEIVKIAEGSYGEVYKMRIREEVCKQEMSKSKLARLMAYGEGVFKVVPLRAAKGAGSKKFTSVNEIVSEVKMLKYLDPIPGFARFREIHVVQGRFPESLQEAWDHYKKVKPDDCLNPNPANKRAYLDSQLWAIIEMDDAGSELEKFSWSSMFQIYDIFWGVAMALARAEEYALFEHRDLHLGNVCIRSTRADGSMKPPTDTEILSRSHSSGYGMSTLETTIIDYSLSRAELQLSEDPSITTEVASSDLDKKQIFDAVGQDEDEALLRDTYRHMRAQLYTGSPANMEKQPDIPGIWSDYAPGTNLVWLRFLLINLLKNKKAEVSSKTARKPLAPCSPNKNITDTKASKKQNKEQKKAPLVVKQIHAAEAELQITQWKKLLEERLESVLDLLDLEHGSEDMCCAADLVAYAIDSQWLGEEDFF